jgi:hypothetical protein
MNFDIIMDFYNEAFSIRRTLKRFEAIIEEDSKKEKKEKEKILKRMKENKFIKDKIIEEAFNVQKSSRDFSVIINNNIIFDFSSYEIDDSENEDKGKMFLKTLSDSIKVIFDYNNHLSNLEIHEKDNKYIKNNFLINLVMAVESTFAQCLKEYYKKYPSSLGTEKKLSVGDIKDLSTIDEIYGLFSQKEIENIIRSSIKDWYLKIKKFGVNIPEYDSLKNDIIEIFQRRNLIVHNKCIVNDIYLSNCKSVARDEVLNTELIIDDKYLMNAIEKLSVFTYSLVFGFAIKDKDFLKNDDNVTRLINDIGFEYMKNNDWRISKWFFDRLRKLDIDNNSKAICEVNYYISCKNLDDTNEMKKLENSDYSDKSKMFRMAKHILLDEFKQGYKLLDELCKDKEITFMNLRTWPLFNWVKGSKEMNELQKKYYRDMEEEGLLVEKVEIKDVDDNVLLVETQIA